MEIERILSGASESLSVRRCFGEPVEHGGTLVIPVAFVAGAVAVARARRVGRRSRGSRRNSRVALDAAAVSGVSAGHSASMS